jgi:hypothetical protein
MVAAVLALGCDAGSLPAHAPPAAAPKELLGPDPATLGPAFDGLALGQAIDQQAAEHWLKQRGLQAAPFVRDGHLASLRLTGNPEVRWPSPSTSLDDQYWFDPARHQHATEIITEQGSYLEFDLEVPIAKWLNATLDSIVPIDLVTKSLEDVEHRIHVPTHSNYVDGRAHVSWTDSALAGAASATQLSVREVHTFKNTRRTASGWEVEEVPGATSHGLYVNLDAAPAIYEAIEHRLTELFGRSVLDSKRSKIKLTHSPAAQGLEHIELSWER